MKTNWWVLFPLKGLELTDPDHDLADPLWSDSTIISKNHARQIIKSMRRNKSDPSGHDHEGGAIYFIDNLTFSEEFQSFVAIKRSGPLLSSVSPELHCDMYEQISGAPEKRASQIGALIELAVLATRKDWMTCALVDQVHSLTRSLIKLSLEDSSFAVEIKGPRAARSILNSSNNERLSRHDLNSRMRSDPIAPLASILLSQNCPLSSSLYNAISESAIRLSDALHVTREADQLLGAVTAIEILIANQSDSFENIKRRIETLIGLKACEYFEVDKVLKSRHLYVHEGKEPEGQAVALKSTGLALCCLLTYADAAPQFNFKPTLLSYLDFIRLGRIASSDWTDEERDALSGFLKHRPDHYRFPFFKP